jgi:hypothetical protein
MTTNRNLLKEAIADAKTIKETAIANAKAALEESFTPHLKEMLAAKLNEMDEMDSMDEMEDMDSMDEMKDMENEAYTIKNDKGGIEEEEIEEYGDEHPMSTKDALSKTDENEIDLEELLAELELEESTEESLYEAEEVEEAEEEEEEEEEIDLENMTEEDLKKFIEGVIEDMVSAGEIEAGHEGEGEGEENEEEMDLDEILFELKKDSKKIERHSSKGNAIAKTKEDTAYKHEIKELQDELAETYEAVNTLRSELNEINLLNAKLLYTNKIFKAKNLTEVQKVKVLSAFDKATSKKEAQLVYETLIEGLKEKKTIVKENLGRASKPAGTATTTKQPILESNDMIARFQKLAGITNL